MEEKQSEESSATTARGDGAKVTDDSGVAYIEFTQVQFEYNLREWGEYSCTIPTGTTIGKKWFRNNDAYAHLRVRDEVGLVGMVERRISGAFPDWWMGEFVEHDPPNPDRVLISWLKVRIVPTKE